MLRSDFRAISATLIVYAQTMHGDVSLVRCDDVDGVSISRLGPMHSASSEQQRPALAGAARTAGDPRAHARNVSVYGPVNLVVRNLFPLTHGPRVAFRPITTQRAWKIGPRHLHVSDFLSAHPDISTTSNSNPPPTRTTSADSAPSPPLPDLGYFAHT